MHSCGKQMEEMHHAPTLPNAKRERRLALPLGERFDQVGNQIVGVFEPHGDTQ